MKIFVSYASDDDRVANEVRYALGQAGHTVFLGSAGLEPAREYHRPLRDEVESSDLFIFLVSPDSLARGRYTLTELGYAKAKWPMPTGFVLPVVLDSTVIDSADPYLTAVTMLEPAGNVAAEVADYVDRLGPVAPPCDVLLDVAHQQGEWNGLAPLFASGYASAHHIISTELERSAAELPEGARFDVRSLGAARALVLPMAPHGGTRLEPSEVAAIRRFVDRGGGLLVLATYTGDWHHEANLSELTERYGILLDNNSVVASGQSARGHLYKSQPDDPHAFDAVPAPAPSRDVRQLLVGVDRVRMLTACTLTTLEDAATPLLVAKDVDTFEPQPAGRGVAIDGYDLAINSTPIVVAAVSRVAKVAVIGSWKLLLNPFVEASESSRHLLINLLGWLAADDRLATASEERIG